MDHLEKKMRYIVGDTVPFVSIEFDDLGMPNYSRLYVPWEHKLTAITVKALKCIEHHKVAWAYDRDGEKRCHGFVFQDMEGGLWHNQYPVAHYGQTDDSADRIIYKAGDLSSRMNDGLSHIENLARGVRIINANGETSYADMLAHHQKEVVQAIESAMGKTVKIKPFEIAKKDGTITVIPDFFEATLSQ